MKNVIFQTIQIETTYASLDGLKLLHLSDLHLNKKTSQGELKKLIAQCNQTEHEVVFITGDVIDCHVKHIMHVIKLLQYLVKPTYVVSGNHDLVYGYEALKKALPQLHFIDNQAIKIKYKEETLQLVGISDRFSKFFGMPRDEQKVKELLSYQPSILLAHQPKDYTLAIQSKTPLFVCGHTHGGQIFPFHFLVKMVQPFLAGLHYVKQTAVYVNRGLGTWGVAYRYKAPAEVTVLQLNTKSVQ